MILREGWCNFNEEELEFLFFVGSGKFPWFLGYTTKNFPGITHTLIDRTDEQSPGIPNSPFAEQAEKMFRRICADNNITVRTIYRMAFNTTFADPSKHGDPHVDHPDFPHKNLLIYINKFDDGETYLLNEDFSIKQVIESGIDKFAVFDGCLHAQGFCKPQQVRQVFVTTFDGDVL